MSFTITVMTSGAVKIILLTFGFISCGRITDTPDGCIASFIASIAEHNMGRAWYLLGPDAQSSYNNMGEKQRRSGKGAFENEIKKIIKLRTIKKDYTINLDNNNPNLVIILLNDGKEYKIETISENGDFKIKNRDAVSNLINAIAEEQRKEDYY
ncbi:MAG: hypothetical protein ACRDFC_02445 [Ignavibacteria bacterium]